MTVVKLDMIRVANKPKGWDGDWMKLPREDVQSETLLATELRDGMYLTEEGKVVQESEEETTAFRLVPHSCTTVTMAEKDIFKAAMAAWTQADILDQLIRRSQEQLAACRGAMSDMVKALSDARAPLPLEQFEESFHRALPSNMQNLLRWGMYQVGSPDGSVPAIAGKIRIARTVDTGKDASALPVTIDNGHPVLNRTAPEYRQAMERFRCPLPISYPLTEGLVLRDSRVVYVGAYYIPFKNKPMTHALAEKTAREFARV